ncbi:YciI family protein [Spongiactinospora sp. TRM90649]|uniref:YciI family protein n=1 Tax=Spongiactinospora sp. TRM90649 TaxID=3031114 RepID=UPI0023F68628|nr:YciI family protein [Spongiactinospora sp. TRM90649]MDF5752875.1 YciI family protein [Spongiactinospora sp. TRM90649]
MLLIYGNHATWNTWGEAEHAETARAHGELIRELVASGEYVASEGLTTLGARTVRVGPEGAPAVTDGPFSEAKEVLAGYYLVDCASADRAAEIAARLPEARHDPIEVRRVMDKSELGM